MKLSVPGSSGCKAGESDSHEDPFALCAQTPGQCFGQIKFNREQTKFRQPTGIWVSCLAFFMSYRLSCLLTKSCVLEGTFQDRCRRSAETSTYKRLFTCKGMNFGIGGGKTLPFVFSPGRFPCWYCCWSFFNFSLLLSIAFANLFGFFFFPLPFFYPSFSFPLII